MKNKISPLAILFTGGVILTAGDIFAAQFTKFGGSINYFFVLIFYILGMMFLIQSYKHEDIAVASTILIIFNIVILTIVGVVFFNEELHMLKIIGIILGLIAVGLLQYKKNG